MKKAGRRQHLVLVDGDAGDDACADCETHAEVQRLRKVLAKVASESIRGMAGS